MITTRELAKLAGVSQATVSRSLNDSPHVSPKIKERVRSIAREHGYIYKKSGGKDTFVSKRKFIGIIMLRNLSFLDIFFINQISACLMTAIENKNYYAMTLRDCYGYQGIDKLNDLLKLNLFEGFIILNQQYDEILSNYLNEIHIPHVLLVYHNRINEPKNSVVDTDNYLGAYMATKHLIDLGHKKIIALTTSLSEFNDRIRGYRSALADNNIEYDSRLIISTDCDYVSAYKITHDRIQTFKSATACFAQYDVGAMAVCNALRDFNINVPKDFSVVGFDDLDISRIFNPALTTIRQPFEQLAEQAVNVLISSINSSNTIHSKIFLEPELMVRDSTAPPRKKIRGKAEKEKIM